MKTYIDFLLEEILLEDVSRTQFRFGFELEGYVKDGSELDKMLFDGVDKFGDNDTKEDKAKKENNSPISNRNRERAYELLKEYFMKDILSGGFSEGELIKDSDGIRIEEAVEDDETLNHKWKHLSFEFKSPVFPHTTEWVRHVISCLQKWIGSGEIFTDDKCGFHNHISYEGMTNEDMIWIYAQMAKNSSYVLRTFGDMQERYGDGFKIITNGKKHTFTNNWSPTSLLQTAKSLLGVNDIKSFVEDANSFKYTLFRMHPKGTIEWRGPRGFMDIPIDSEPVDVSIYTKDDNTIEKRVERRNAKSVQAVRNIQQFYTMMLQLVRFFIKCEKQKTIVVGNEIGATETITREEFFDRATEKQNLNTVKQRNQITPFLNNGSDISALKEKISEYTITPTEQYNLTSNNRSFFKETNNTLIIKEYTINGRAYNFVCSDEKHIQLFDCEITTSYSLKMRYIDFNGCSFKSDDNALYRSMDISNCTFDSTSFVGNMQVHNESGCRSCTFSKDSIVEIFVIGNYGMSYTNNVFMCDVNLIVLDLNKATCRFIRNFVNNNTIHGELVINTSDDDTVYDKERWTDSWITNDTKYKALLKKIDEKNTLDISDLEKFD